MGLFFDVLRAINNPHQSGSVEQLGTIVHAAQQLGVGSGLDPLTLQTVMSSLGEVLLPTLKQQSLAPGGYQALDSLVNQFSGADANADAVPLPSFFTPHLQQQMVQTIAQKTGLSAGQLQPLLPGLISIAMGFLSMGAPQPGVADGNPILNAVLDSDQDGSTDLGDVFKFANRLLNVPS